MKVLHAYYSLGLIFQQCNKFQPLGCFLANGSTTSSISMSVRQWMCILTAREESLYCVANIAQFQPQKTTDIFSYPQRQRTLNSFLYFTKAKTRLVEKDGVPLLVFLLLGRYSRKPSKHFSIQQKLYECYRNLNPVCFSGLYIISGFQMQSFTSFTVYK